MTEKIGEMDPDQATAFAEACGSITTSAMAGLKEATRDKVLGILEHGGGNLYLHVQMVPEFVVVLALDTGDPQKPNLELARWSGAATEPIRRALN